MFYDASVLNIMQLVCMQFLYQAYETFPSIFSQTESYMLLFCSVYSLPDSWPAYHLRFLMFKLMQKRDKNVQNAEIIIVLCYLPQNEHVARKKGKFLSQNSSKSVAESNMAYTTYTRQKSITCLHIKSERRRRLKYSK